MNRFFIYLPIYLIIYLFIIKHEACKHDNAHIASLVILPIYLFIHLLFVDTESINIHIY